MSTCSRCGRASELEYGSDGLAYCSACIFYGINKQCSKCRMYIPASELQQYKGMWACPYCIQDMRDEDRKMSEYKAPEYRKRDEPLPALSYSETCERCGKDLGNRVYIWNGRRLCKNCLADEQEKWGVVGGGPMGASQRISYKPMRLAKKKSFIEGIFSDLLALFGVKQREKEIIVVEPKMPIKHAKPMTEGRAREKESKSRETSSQIEGLMKKKKK